jgi:putative salt-induced outer membrane protein YdiY
MRRPITRSLLATIVLSMATGTALAGDPVFEKPKTPEEIAKMVEWKAAVQAGLILTTGNSETTTTTVNATASRRQGMNKLQIDIGGAYARSSIFIASDVNNDGFITANEIQNPSSTTTRAWEVKARYDRFLTAHNALYALAKLGADEPAGKELVGGAQIGYSRQLYKTDVHEFVGEVGYDFTYEDSTAGDGVAIHSGRGFLGYTGKLSDDTGVKASTELLMNVNELDQPQGQIDPLEDTRVTSVIELSTKLHDNISFSFGFTAKFDNAPSPRPAFEVPYAAGFVPLADELDTITKASLIINFL